MSQITDLAKSKQPKKEFEFPKKDADQTVALSPDTVKKIESVFSEVNKTSSDNAKLIEKALSTTESPEAIVKALLEIAQRQSESKVDFGELIAQLKEEKTITIHLDNADNLEKPQPIIFSIGDDFKKLVQSIENITKPEVVVRENTNVSEIIKAVEKIKNPQVIIKENKEIIEAIRSLESRPVTVTMPENLDRWQKIRCSFVRNDNNLTKEIIMEKIA